jgi:hypothetical protein
MGSRFGFDFSTIRIHSDERAARRTSLLNSHAVTIGNHIFIDPRERQRPSAHSVLAHELAHVAQQRLAGRAYIQPKLRLTGDAASITRALAILNGGLFGWSVTIDAAGTVSLARNNIQGPPTVGQDALRARLESIVNDSSTVSVAMGSGTGTLVGSYAGESVDIADIEAMGSGPGGSIAALIHELVEQYQKQVKGTAYGSDTTGAHGAGVAAEAAVAGATRGAQRVVSHSSNPDGSINAVIEVPYTYPDGRVVIVTTEIDHNNVRRVTRR